MSQFCLFFAKLIIETTISNEVTPNLGFFLTNVKIIRKWWVLGLFSGE